MIDESVSMRLSHRRRLLRRAGERVEDATLRVGVEQRLRFVLPVQIDELPADLGEHAGVHRRAVDPGARAARRQLRA